MTNETFPLSIPATVHLNQPVVALVEESIRRGEARFASTGALVVETGAHTGRSAQDKFTVRDDATETTVWWDNNKPMTREQFDLLLEDFKAHAASRELFVQDLFAGADPDASAERAHLHRVRLARGCSSATCCAARARPSWPASRPQFTVVNLPSFRPTPSATACAPRRSSPATSPSALVLIGGTSYAGETKKSVFTFLNYLMPEHGVMPMHCSANVGPGGDVGGVLRPLRHRQDDAVGRSQAHAARRRRARLVDGRHLQFRGRLLRQDHPPLRRRPSPRSGPRPTASAPCSRTSSSKPGNARCPISTTAG